VSARGVRRDAAGDAERGAVSTADAGDADRWVVVLVRESGEKLV
jgi:hypothetical protein